MTERELERQARHGLAVLGHAEEISGNVAATCRYYGISRNCYYKWLRRYEAEGLEGLKDRSSAPHNSPQATSVEVVGDRATPLCTTSSSSPRCWASARATSCMACELRTGRDHVAADSAGPGLPGAACLVDDAGDQPSGSGCAVHVRIN